MAELNDFLKDLGVEPESILDKPLNLGTDEEPEKETPAHKVELDEDGYPKNRQGRRKRQKDEERDNEIQQLNERVKVLSEAEKFKADVGDDAYSKLDAILGNNEPGKLAATNILKEVIKDLTEKNKTELRQEWESRGAEETKAQQEADSEVDEFLEIARDAGLNVDDDNVDSGLRTLMARMSSKYSDGNIKEFADPEAVVETYKELQKRGGGSERAKELASRGMTRSGESQPSTLPQNAIERYMKEHGLEW